MLALAVVALAAVAVTLAGRDAANPPPARPAPATVPPERVLAKSPYAGIACPVPNSIACDRMGLAVWTRRPARSVQASVSGRTFALDDAEWSGPPRMFAGFLRRADLRGLGVRTEGGDHWTGVHPVTLPVRLLITGADGTRSTTIVRVPLSAGWG